MDAIFKQEWWSAMDQLTDEQKNNLVSAIISYQLFGAAPVLDSRLEIAFNIIKVQVDSIMRKKAEISGKRSLAGKSGGRGKKKQKKTKKANALFALCDENLSGATPLQDVDNQEEKTKKANALFALAPQKSSGASSPLNNNFNNNPPLKENTTISSSAKESFPRVMKRPTLEEVQLYVEEYTKVHPDKPKIDAQRFIDYNIQVGWVVGRDRKPMKDWKAAVRTWMIQEMTRYSDKPTELGREIISTKNYQAW